MYDQEEFSGNQYVLEEGIYPDLTAMGCSPQAVLKSLQMINIVSKAVRNIVKIGTLMTLTSLFFSAVKM